MIRKEQGSDFLFEGYFYNSVSVLTNVTTPTITIISEDDVVVVNAATPTHVSTGYYTYLYPIPSNATPGIWIAQWSGMVGTETYVGYEAFIVTLAGTVSTTTLSNLIDSTKQYLYTGTHEVRSKISAGIDADDTSLTLTYDNGAFQPGIRVSVGLEDMYVWERSGNVLTIDRGQFGTAPAPHTAADLILAQPKFSDAEIFREINNEIASLISNGIYRVGSLNITLSAIQSGYELANFAPDYEVMEVRVRTIGPFRDWPIVSGWLQESEANTSDFPSGHALFLTEPVPFPSTLHVTYKAPFTQFAALTDFASDTGLTNTMLDLPAIGAAIRLTAGREIKRNFDEWQGETRRAGEVPAGANLGASRNLMLLRRDRLREEADRLSTRFPVRLKRETIAWG